MSVEHGYGFIQKYWTKSGFHLITQANSSPVTAYYLASCLMSNIMTCLRRNQISVQFDCLSSSLDEYFGGLLAEDREDMEIAAV